MNFLCLVNLFTISRLFIFLRSITRLFIFLGSISRLFIFLRRYRKTKTLKKTMATKISHIKKWRYNLFILQKTGKNRILTIHSIRNYSDHLFSVSYGDILSFILILFFSGYFCKLWCISDLISTYYLSMENWPCNLCIEIFDKLRICYWVWQNLCSGNFV